MDIEAVVARRLMAQVGCKAFLEVPADAPERFIVVEQTGGGGAFKEDVQLDIDCFAQANQRKAAKALAREVGEAVPDLDAEPNVFNPRVENTYRLNDPESGRSRYIVQISLTTCE